MWPKMLFELLPHLARLMPMADRFLTTRSASEKAQEAALAALAGEFRANSGQLVETHAGFERALTQQAEQIAAVAVEATRARIAVESAEARLGEMERSLRSVMTLARVLAGMLVLALVLLGMVAALLLRR